MRGVGRNVPKPAALILPIKPPKRRRRLHASCCLEHPATSSPPRSCPHRPQHNSHSNTCTTCSTSSHNDPNHGLLARLHGFPRKGWQGWRASCLRLRPKGPASQSLLAQLAYHKLHARAAGAVLHTYINTLLLKHPKRSIKHNFIHKYFYTHRGLHPPPLHPAGVCAGGGAPLLGLALPPRVGGAWARQPPSRARGWLRRAAERGARTAQGAAAAGSR